MKRLIKLSQPSCVRSRVTLFAVALIFLQITGPQIAWSQDKSDVVVMVDGQRKEGKVTSIDSERIKFKYKGEDLEYDLSKTDIDHIEFASGRTEVFRSPAQTGIQASSGSTVPAESRKGKLAVLPFNLNTNDQGLSGDNMSKQIQSDCISSFRKYSHGLDIIDAHTVNALLAQNNLTADRIAVLPPKELATILGVQYVVAGDAEIMNKGTSTYGSGVSTYKDKNNQNKSDGQKSSKSSGTSVSTLNTSTTIEYGTKIAMDVFDDEGKSVFSQKRDTFGSGVDAYIGSLDYMVKRTPFGSKAK